MCPRQRHTAAEGEIEVLIGTAARDEHVDEEEVSTAREDCGEDAEEGADDDETAITTAEEALVSEEWRAKAEAEPDVNEDAAAESAEDDEEGRGNAEVSEEATEVDDNDVVEAAADREAQSVSGTALPNSRARYAGFPSARVLLMREKRTGALVAVS